MVAVSIVAGLLLLGVAFGAFDFSGLLDDLFSGGNSSDTPTDEPETVMGGDGDDLLQADNSDNDIQGAAGDDSIDAGGGDDQVFGGQGDDSVAGGDGADTLFGDQGNDTLFAGAGQDIVFGGAGNDHIDGGGNPDTIFGGDGDDLIEARYGADIVNGGLGMDTLKGGAGDDVLLGYEDSQLDDKFENTDVYDPDRLVGGAGMDVLVGGSGDTLNGGEGADALTLGSWIDPNNPVHIEDYEAAQDVIVIVVPDTYQGGGAVTIDYAPSGTSAGTLFLDGVRVAEIQGASDSDTILPSSVVVHYDANFA